jgi:hypothetical protein
MTVTVENLKKMFTKEEARSFNIMHAETMRAVNAFAAEGSKAFFVEDKSAYSRDMNCKINFTLLHLVVRQVAKDEIDMEELNESLEDLPKALAELTQSLNVFRGNDGNEERKSIYDTGLSYITKVSSCLVETDFRKDNMEAATAFSILKKYS